MSIGLNYVRPGIHIRVFDRLLFLCNFNVVFIVGDVMTDLPQSYLQYHDFYLNRQTFVARFQNKEDAKRYQDRHPKFDMVTRYRKVEGQNDE